MNGHINESIVRQLCVVMPKLSFINLYQNSLFIKVPNLCVDIFHYFFSII